MICNNCGNDIPDGVYACPSCGTPVPGAGGPPPESYYTSTNNGPSNYQQPYPQQQYGQPYPQQQYGQPMYSEAPKSNSSTMIIIGIAVGIIAILCILLMSGIFTNGDYDGKYKLYSAKVMGIELNQSELSSYGLDPDDYIIEINGNKATLKFESRTSTVKVKVSGDSITLGSGSNSLEGDYDKSKRTILLTYEGVDMTFKD